MSADRMSASVPRFGHGSRVPGWDDEVDLTKPPAVIPDVARTPVPEALRAEIESAMAKYPDRRSAAIPALHAAQRVHGYCSPTAIDQVAAVMQLTPAYLTSVASFYDMLELEPRGHHHDVYVCTNISCSLLGGDEFFDAMVRAAGGAEDLHVRSFECLGACDIAPMASIDGEYVGPLELADAERIVADLRAGGPVLRDKQLRFRPSVDPHAGGDGTDFGAPPADAPRADTAGRPFQIDNGGGPPEAGAASEES
ncbi:MAG TPA: NAD(P)H-dependent oxidoreductase subunit E [Solirubrobacteraceae bacterium]|nr:NAD(P)H-dependent oxidoreductase subunit E [Solirubrobacteraceae bacterium]